MAVGDAASCDAHAERGPSVLRRVGKTGGVATGSVLANEFSEGAGRSVLRSCTPTKGKGARGSAGFSRTGTSAFLRSCTAVGSNVSTEGPPKVLRIEGWAAASDEEADDDDDDEEFDGSSVEVFVSMAIFALRVGGRRDGPEAPPRAGEARALVTELRVLVVALGILSMFSRRVISR